MDAVQQQWDQAMLRLRDHMFERDIAPLRGELLKYCRRLTGDAAAAEDLQQEVMIRGLALCRVCGGPENSKAYLLRSAANLWVDHLRRRKKEALLPDDVLRTPATQSPGEVGAEWLDHLARILPPREYEVFLLRDVHGYTGAETARLVGATEAAVKMAASRARQRIRASTV